MNQTANEPKNISRRRECLIGLFLVLITVGVYWPVGNFDFVNIDDWAYVTGNTEIQNGLSWGNFKWAFQTHFASNWHPLTALSHMLDCQLFGVNAGPHHLTNLLFHALNTILLFVVLRRMTGALWRSAMVAALFALHPLHVESVAWISERKDVLSGFFFLLTLWAYANYVQSSKPEDQIPARFRGATFYILALIFFALGLLSKPMLVTLPFVLLLLDFWPLERIAILNFKDSGFHNLAKLFLEKLPFFGLSAASSVITFWAQKSGGAIVNLESISIQSRIANALISYVLYLFKTIWPKSLAVFYPYQSGAAWKVVGSIILLATLTTVTVLLLRRRKYLFVGWVWFLGMLVPVIGLVQVGAQSLADRYTYLPLIGIFVALVWLSSELLSSWRRRGLIVAAVSLMAGCVVVTSLQIQHWKNSETLFGHAIRVTHRNAPVHNYLGVVLEAQGKTNEAMAHYHEAIQIFSGFVDPHCNLAIALARQNRRVEAIAEFEKTLRLRPDFVSAHFGWAEVLVKEGKKDEAQTHYEAAIRIQPEFAEAHYQLAVLLADERKTAEAILHFKEAIRLKPTWLEPLNNLAWILATNPDPQFRDAKLAVELAERASVVSRNKNPGVLDTLAAAYAEGGQFQQAVDKAEAAIVLSSGHGQMEKEIQTRLKLYQSKQAFREVDDLNAISDPANSPKPQ